MKRHNHTAMKQCNPCITYTCNKYNSFPQFHMLHENLIV